MATHILGQGTALPEHAIDVQESVQYAADYFARTDEQRRMLPLLYRMAGVKRRHSVLLTGPSGDANRHGVFPRPADENDNGPMMRRRMEIYEERAPQIATEASGKALERSNMLPGDVSHLVTVSCSGFAAPGVDIKLIKRLGLAPTVKRTHVGFMGCHGAINGMRVAQGFCDSDPKARVLLCAVELCSLHYHYGWDPDRLVANALFADGSAAMILSGSPNCVDDGWKLVGSGSCLIPDSEDAMTWRLANHGFIMSLSARVPELIGSYLKDWMTHWLSEYDLKISDIATWAVHPGGPRILTATSKALELPEGALNVSKEILRDYGNMSSPTILFILDRLRKSSSPKPCVALGFGPGLMAEAVLFA
jgi:prepilin-type processing-associated H-X9-DG protein